MQERICLALTVGKGVILPTPGGHHANLFIHGIIGSSISVCIVVARRGGHAIDGGQVAQQRRLQPGAFVSAGDNAIEMCLHHIGQQVGLSVARLRRPLDHDDGIKHQLVAMLGKGFREDDHFAAALQVLEHHIGHQIAFLGRQRAN